jgi:hypothetical protein
MDAASRIDISTSPYLVSTTHVIVRSTVSLTHTTNSRDVLNSSTSDARENGGGQGDASELLLVPPFPVWFGTAANSTRVQPISTTRLRQIANDVRPLRTIYMVEGQVTDGWTGLHKRARER